MGKRRLAVAAITYRRPEQLTRLLRSLEAIEPPPESWCLQRMIVVDNDPNGSAATAAKDFEHVDYHVEPRPGIAAARNRAVDAALEAGADWIAFVDDDETVDSGWLRNLVARADSSSADVVMGRVLVRHPQSTPTWYRALGVFEDIEFTEGTSPSYFITGNCLLRIRPTLVDPPLFDDAFGLTGGSDHHLGERLKRDGIEIAYAADAVTEEHMPAGRISLRHALRRLSRTGNVMVRVDIALAREEGSSDLRPRARGVTMGLARIVFGGIKAIIGLPRGRVGVASGVRTASVGVGQVSASLNMTIEEYRRSNS